MGKRQSLRPTHKRRVDVSRGNLNMDVALKKLFQNAS